MSKLLLSSAVALATLSTVANAADTSKGGFIDDSKATLALRNLWFGSDNRDGTAAPSRTEEWAQGFLFKYESGFTQGTVGIGLDAMALVGVTLDSGRGRHVGGSMIPSDSDRAADSWSSLGPTVKLRFDKTEARYGTLQPKLPILLYNDSRVLPQTFQGTQITSKDIDGLTLTGGLLEHAVGRASTDRTGLSVVGGTRDSNKFYFAGGDWAATDQLKAQYYFAKMDDFYTQNFLGLVHILPINKYSSFTTDVRYFRTNSSGANSSEAGRAEGYLASGYTDSGTGEIDNTTWSISGTYALGGHSVMLGYQRVSDGSNFVQPNQGSLVDKGAGGSSYYLQTDRMIQSFIRAGERTTFGQYGYDFAGLGIPGLKASVIYLKGSNAQVANASDASEWERDIALDYVFQDGPLKGLGLGWRNGETNSDIIRDQDQNRVIVSYTLPLL